MSTTVPHEIEVKLRIQSVEPLSKAGISLRLDSARHFEDNWLLDTARYTLGGSEAILRVRKAGQRGAITYKEKTPPDAPPSQFKKRIEIETAIDDPESAVEILQRLGYNKWFRYQKYRTVYSATLPDGDNLQVMFDETPVGNFIELEGEEKAIEQAVKLLGITPSQYILESYL